MADKSRLSLNTATVKSWTLEQCVEACVRHGIPALDPWRDIVQKTGAEAAGKLISENGLKVSGLCRGGMFTGEDEAKRQLALDDNKKAVDEACAIGADCLVLVVGGLPAKSKDLEGARTQVRDGIGGLLDYARSCNMPLGLEPLHPMYAADRACVNTLKQANDLCDELGEGLGVAIDVYHVWWEPNLEQEIARAGKRILGYHVCDWLVPTRDLLLDRGMMGDGVIDLKTFSSWIEKAGYDGLIEVEIFSAKNWWNKPGDDVLEVVIERFETHV